MAKVLEIKQLELLLQTHWTQFMNKTKLMSFVLINVRDNEYPKIMQDEIPARNTKIVITKFTLNEPSDSFELWIEFNVPREEGFVVGTHICDFLLNGELLLKETLGTFFTPQKMS